MTGLVIALKYPAYINLRRVKMMGLYEQSSKITYAKTMRYDKIRMQACPQHP